ncbi:hypothetical protein RS030_111853 [Cryptosporidium xiaoi]|uniref:Uncharacterized protein n=1 Tax=Cryptosporidium xiaoi TaxID=659607 RepID=A0AAV9Y2V0_9CRYT
MKCEEQSVINNDNNNGINHILIITNSETKNHCFDIIIPKIGSRICIFDVGNNNDELVNKNTNKTELIEHKDNAEIYLYIKNFEDECLRLTGWNSNKYKFYDTCNNIISIKGTSIVNTDLNINTSNNTKNNGNIINNINLNNNRKLQIKSGFGSHIRLPPMKTTLLNEQNNENSISNLYNTWDVCNSILSLHFIKICEKLCTDNSIFSVKEEIFPRSCFPSCNNFAKNICIQGCNYFECNISYELCTYQMCNFYSE